MANEPSPEQIGYVDENGKRVEPTRCAVSNRDVRGKNAVTHYGPDKKFVYVLSQYDYLWPDAAPAYGFPVPERPDASKAEGFRLESLDRRRGAREEVTVTDNSGVIDRFAVDATPSVLSTVTPPDSTATTGRARNIKIVLPQAPDSGTTQEGGE